MSTCTQEVMTNHHVDTIWGQFGDTVQTWRRRYQARRELSHWTERDLHDVGLSWSDIANEAEKPFWRA